MLGVLRCLAVSVLCLTVSSTTAKLVYKDEVSVNNKCLVYDTVKKFFKYENKLVVMVTENSADYLAELPITAVILTVDNNCDRHQTVDHEGYVVFTTTNNNSLLNNTLNVWKCFNNTVTNLKTKRVLIVDVVFGEVNHTENYLSYFHHLWREFGIIHVVILQDNRNKQEKIFAYNPFQEDNLVSPRTLLEFTLSDDFTGLLQKRLRNLNGHSLKAGVDSQNVNITLLNNPSVVEVTRDIMFKRTLESHFNVTLVSREASIEDFRASIKRRLSVKFYMMEKYNLDYYVASIIISHDISRFKFLSTHSTTSLLLLVKKSPRIQGWEVFLHIYQWEVCVGIGIVVIVLSIIASLMWKTLERVDSAYSDRVPAAASICKAVITFPISRLPVTNSQRFMIALPLVLGVIIVSPFCSQMFYLIKEQPRLHPINTVDDLLSSDKRIIGPLSDGGHLDHSTDAVLQQIKKKLVKNGLYEYYHHPQYGYKGLYVFTTTDDAILYMEHAYKAQKVWYKNCMNFDDIHSLDDVIATLQLSYVMPANSIYFDSFNDLSLKLYQSGLLGKWPAYSENVSNSVCDETLPNNLKSSEDVAVDALALTDFMLPLYILLGGLTLATLCFFAEIVYRRTFV